VRSYPTTRSRSRHSRSLTYTRFHCRHFEGANPRHAHEWATFAESDIPEDKSLCPGVIEPQSNSIEHPELVAQRIERWAGAVGAHRLMAGVDCGFSVHVGLQGIDPDVAFARGCEIASDRLFG
jgi:5-methyltetrahydropteroyltriglutamate--homocysteine methyltransferase